MIKPFHTETFEKIPAEKKERILNAAMTVLGRDGVAGARMADIARLASISHGSLFSYFPTKDHLVRALILRGITLQSSLFDGIDNRGGFGAALKAIFKKAWTIAEANGPLISLWLSLSQSENERFAEDILSLEREGSGRWSALIDAGYAEGAIEPSLDKNFVSFIVDAGIAQLLKSRASELEREKFSELYGGEIDAGEILAAGLVKLLSPR